MLIKSLNSHSPLHQTQLFTCSTSSDPHSNLQGRVAIISSILHLIQYGFKELWWFACAAQFIKRRAGDYPLLGYFYSTIQLTCNRNWMHLPSLRSTTVASELVTETSCCFPWCTGVWLSSLHHCGIDDATHGLSLSLRTWARLPQQRETY